MKIGIVGTGMVGRALAERFIQKGHEVMLGSRDPSSAKKKLSKDLETARVGTYADTTHFANILVLAVHWNHVRQTLEKMGNLDGKIVIDCVNPLASNLTRLDIGSTGSAAEEIAKLAPNAKIVKAFNSIGAQNYKDPNIDGQKASGFICGDDKEAKKVVSKLVEDVGFEVIDVGPLSNARMLEQLALLWVNLAFVQGFGPSIGFKLLKR
jgi:NADPH-dependent F420 reductase